MMGIEHMAKLATKRKPTFTCLPKRNEGESDRNYFRRVAAFLSGKDVRSVGDNREWTGSLPFHLSRD